ncbi:MAG: FKBP-type peptidyl-prolyl cis-trans isomerase [Xanthomonadales bacterium]|nr:FKBP-type peptidyl-prolyl cis-trans isomerase [Xanthomonadales bacterium]
MAASGALWAQEIDQSDLSYMLGYDVGGRLTEMEVELDYDRFMEALKDAMAGNENALGDERLAEIRDAFNQQQQALVAQKQEERRKELAEAAERNKQEGEAFLARNAEREGVMTTDSGLQYEVIEMGEGAKPSAEDTVTVHYTGTLIDGTKFDSSVDRGQPATFALNRVISGWTEGLQLMPEGSKFRFYIPSDLAYGGRSMGETIGPNSTLVFDVELISVGQ